MLFIPTKNEWKVGFRLLWAFADMLTHRPSCGGYVQRHARVRPNNIAVFFNDREITWAELNADANRIANLFSSLGAKPGDTVALYMENCPEFMMILAGLSKIGVVTSLINTNLRHKTLSHAMTICSPRWIVVGASLLPVLEEIQEGLPVKRDKIFVWDGEAPADYKDTDLALLTKSVSSENPPKIHRHRLSTHALNIYTSGTTGLPKAARVSNRRWFFSGWALGYAMSNLSSRDVIYVPLPLYHSIGMYVGWGGALVVGAGIGIRRRFSASEFWSEAKRIGATATTFIGEMPRYLLNQPPRPEEKDHGIRQVITVGLRANVWEEFEKRFGIGTIFEFYGATETNVGIMNADGRPGFLGRLVPLQALVVRWDQEAEDFVRDKRGRCIICEPGETGVMLGRSISLLGFDGYLDDRETQAKIMKGVRWPWDEFFNTGDMVKVHEDRWVSFVDRVGDTFRWKGENVATKEVEMILDGHPAVKEINVYGVEVPGQEGRAGMAAAVFEPGWNCEEFSRFVQDNLPHYARPLFLRDCKEMQTTITFKHVKYNLRKEGFSPSVVKDRLYFWDRSREFYVPLEEDLYADIVNGNTRL